MITKIILIIVRPIFEYKGPPAITICYKLLQPSKASPTVL